MDGTKIFIVMLVVIAILFAVGIGSGMRHDPNEKVDLNSGPLVFLQQTFAKPQPLELQDLTSPAPATCIQGTRLIVPRLQTCTLSIKASGTAARRITFNIPVNAVLKVTLDQPNALKVTQNLPTDASEHLDVYKDGGTLQLTCMNSLSSACILTLK